jgi:N-acetyl-1-D-myo-inositol-2-amino-2-deoxy-alpha-D-glucopyranoside deacetylase
LAFDALGAHRIGELDHALSALGAVGEVLRYRDSGMRWGTDGAVGLAELDPRSLCAAPLEEVVAAIGAVIARIGADSVVSYDASGGYGHPDHIRAHQAARLAAGSLPFYAITSNGPIVVDASAVLERKRAALAAHRTQLSLSGNEFVLSNGSRHAIDALERFELLARIGSLPR